MADYAGQNAIGASTKPATAASAIEDFDAVISRLETLVEKASNAADKVVGSRPSPVGKPESAPTPQHLIYQIQTRRTRLVNAVDHLETEISRLDNGLA